MIAKVCSTQVLTRSDADLKSVTLAALWSMYLIMERPGGRRQLQHSRQSTPHRGLNQTAALRSGKKDRLKMIGENQHDFFNQLDTGEREGLRYFKDDRFFYRATLMKRNMTFRWVC